MSQQECKLTVWRTVGVGLVTKIGRGEVGYRMGERASVTDVIHLKD